MSTRAKGRKSARRRAVVSPSSCQKDLEISAEENDILVSHGDLQRAGRGIPIPGLDEILKSQKCGKRAPKLPPEPQGGLDLHISRAAVAAGRMGFVSVAFSAPGAGDGWAERAPLSLNSKGFATGSVENCFVWSWNSSQSCSGPCLELGSPWVFSSAEELTPSLRVFPFPSALL